MLHTYVQCASPFLLVTISANIYRICVIELILVFAVVWKWKVVESELRRKNVEKFHPGIALRVYLRHTCANCIALKPRAIWITWFAKVNFVFQFDCNRGGSVRARRERKLQFARCKLRACREIKFLLVKLVRYYNLMAPSLSSRVLLPRTLHNSQVRRLWVSYTFNAIYKRYNLVSCNALAQA